MTLNELLEVLWRRKLIVLAVTVIAVGAAIGALRVVTPEYESTSSLSVLPTDATNAIYILGVVDTITPVFADAATAPETLEQAEDNLPQGMSLSPITVQTFEGTPTFKVTARDSDPETARASAQAVSDALLARQTTGDLDVSQVRLAQYSRPRTPTEAVFPRPAMTIAVALLLGLALGIGAALVRENLTTKVETPEAAERIAGVPSFAEIPNEPALVRVHSAQDFADPQYRVVAEALRDLRTNLLFTKGNLRSIVVTSPEGSHGKTTVSFGLAVSFARAGARTLLIDTDLRKGRVSELLNVQRTPGLSEVLRGHPLETAIRNTSMDNLDFVTGGRLGEDPGELLMSELPGLLHQLERTYDMVILDSTPLVPISDARIAARFAKATLIVASAETTTRRQLKTAVERLSIIGIQPTALVLNNYRSPNASSYYGPAESSNGSRQGDKKSRRRLTRV
jgi:capsular exopolysaccharide synthesis family protein